MEVYLFCCSLYLVPVLIVVIMGRWPELSACDVCHVISYLYKGDHLIRV